jgi:hypothetical protein
MAQPEHVKLSHFGFEFALLAAGTVTGGVFVCRVTSISK